MQNLIGWHSIHCWVSSTLNLIWGLEWMSFYFPARSRAMAAVSGVPFSMYIIQAFSMYWMASGIFFCSCLKGNKARWRHLYLYGTCLLAVKTAGTLTFIIIPACSIALWIWGIALATHVGFFFLLVSVITVVKKKKRRHLLCSVKKPVSLVKEMFLLFKITVKRHSSQL